MKKLFRPVRYIRLVDRFLIKHLGPIKTYQLRLMFIYVCRYTSYWNYWPFRKSAYNYYPPNTSTHLDYHASTFKYRHYRAWNDKAFHKTVFKRSMAVTKIIYPEIFQKEINNLKTALSSPDKVFYIAQVGSSYNGMFNQVERIMLQCAYALTKGYIPVADWQNCKTLYLEADKFGKENAWEYYFLQPCGYSLNDLQLSGRIDVSERLYADAAPISPFLMHDNPIIFNFMLTLYREFFRLNEDVTRHVDEEYGKLIKPGMRVLGVGCRGTDYTTTRPNLHAIQPEIEDVIEKAKQCLVDWNCEYIYLTCDELKVVELFEETFPNKVLTVSRLYYEAKDGAIHGKFDRENDTYLRGLEYLTSVIILSRCDCMIGGIAGGTMSALFINDGKYEHYHMFKLGEYGVDD